MDVNIEKKLINQDKMINNLKMIDNHLFNLFFNNQEKEDEKIIHLDDLSSDHPLNFLQGQGFLIVFFYLFLLVLLFLYGGGGEVGPEPAPPSKNKKKQLLGFQQQKSWSLFS